MHRSAMLRMQWFVEHYILGDKPVRVLDVGSYDVNGSYRELFDEKNNVYYVGLDMSDGPNVDYVPEDPYVWSKIPDGSFDFIISGNAFEHIEYPWLTMEQIYRKLKSGGIACILAPHTIGEHRYPVDCYRFFSDGFRALAKWAKLDVVDVTVGGMSQREVTKEWLIDNLDDTMMIVAKEIDQSNLDNLPKMPYEIRLGYDSGWKRRYDFLVTWINIVHKETQIKRFMNNNGFQAVYLYGWGAIGKLIYDNIKNAKINIKGVIDLNADKLHDIQAIKTGVKIDENEDVCMLVSVLDDGLLCTLDHIYPRIKKYYVNEIYKLEDER